MLYMRKLVNNYSEPIFAKDGTIKEFRHVLICLGEVQKSGAKVYFRPANNDFTCNGTDFFDTYKDAFNSENW